MQLIKNLKWRYATKKYDNSKKVSEKHIDIIKEAIRLSPSSYGLQPYKIKNIKNAKLREDLKPLSWGQNQITDASHLFLFCNSIEVTDKDVDDFIKLKSSINKIPVEKLSSYGDFIKTKLSKKSEIEMFHWTAKQTYIALSNAINACAELEIDCTPIEGFEPEEYNFKLELNKEGLNACVLLAVGYRHNEDTAQQATKVRKGLNKIFEEI